MFGKLFDTVITSAVSPVRDGADVISGFTEGELRKKAALRLGADIVAGMTLSEIVDFLLDEDD